MPEELDTNRIAAEFIQKNIDSFLAIGKGVLKLSTNKLRLRLDSTYTSYISCLFDRHSKAKSFFIRTESVYLYDFYVPLAIKVARTLLDRPDITSLARISPRLVVAGTAGSGKTVFMRHLLLSCLFAKAKVPIFIELRHLNQTDDTLRDLIYRTLRSFQFRLDQSYVDAALKAGHFAL